MVCIYTKKSCPSQIFVHQTCVCCVFFISDLPISSTNTPDNSPLATCDDSKFQDIEKQLRDSDKNPVGCIGWWGGMSKFPWRSCLSTHKAFFFWEFLGEVKTNIPKALKKLPCFRRWDSLRPPFFFGSACFAVCHQVSWSSITSPSRLGGPANRWPTDRWFRTSPDAQLTNWQVRNPPFFLRVLVGHW